MANEITVEGLYTQEIEKRDVSSDLNMYKPQDEPFITKLNSCENRTVVQPEGFEYFSAPNIQRKFTISEVVGAVQTTLKIDNADYYPFLVPGQDIMVISSATATLREERHITAVTKTGSGATGSVTITIDSGFTNDVSAGDILWRNSNSAEEISEAQRAISGNFVKTLQNMGFFRSTVSTGTIAQNASKYFNWWEVNKRTLAQNHKTDEAGKCLFGNGRTDLTGDNATSIYTPKGLLYMLENGLLPTVDVDFPSYVNPTGQYYNFNGLITFPKLLEMVQAYKLASKDQLFWYVNNKLSAQLTELIYNKTTPQEYKDLDIDVKRISLDGVNLNIVEYPFLDKVNYGGGFITDWSDVKKAQFKGFEGYQAVKVLLANNKWSKEEELVSSKSIIVESGHKHGKTKI